MFRNIWDRIKEAGAYLLNSRLVMLILVFCLSSSILIGRLFYLQIVKGEDYLQSCLSDVQARSREQEEIFMTGTGNCWHITSLHIR